MPLNRNGGELKCSPGLWTTKPENDYIPAQVWGDGLCLADVFGESRAGRSANASIMAASKDLYVNLVTLIDCLETINAEVLPEPINLDHIREAKAALKKARGEK